jgi:hypothetical protein
MLSLREARS